MNNLKIMVISLIISISIIAISNMIIVDPSKVNGLLIGAALYLGIEGRIARDFGGKDGQDTDA